MNSQIIYVRSTPNDEIQLTISGSCYPQFHIAPIGVQVQHGPKLPPL